MSADERVEEAPPPSPNTEPWTCVYVATSEPYVERNPSSVSLSSYRCVPNALWDEFRAARARVDVLASELRACPRPEMALRPKVTK